MRQCVHQCVHSIKYYAHTVVDRGVIWQRYIDMHMDIERIMLDQGKGYTTESIVAGGGRAQTNNTANGRPLGCGGGQVVSIRSR